MNDTVIEYSQDMIRQTKYFLATSCFIALGVIIYRYASLGNTFNFPGKTKIYNFSLGKNAVTIKQGSFNQVENVEWTKDSLKDNDLLKDGDLFGNDAALTTTVAKPGLQITERPHIIRINTKRPTTFQTTRKKTALKLTTHKATEKSVVTLPPLTKSAPSLKVPSLPVAMPKPTISVVTFKPGYLPACSHEGENLVGSLRVDQSVPASEEDIDKDWDEKDWVLKGGAWRPTKCQAISKVAIIIPYRNREQQLKIFLRHMHPMLKRQLLDYRIMVIEQAGSTPFNRAMLFNIGYIEALQFHDFKCFIFHDVDLIPENDKNYYGCPSAPRHLSVAVDKFNYRLPYQAIFGGAGAFKREDFETINGFSNHFWGWGGEDDDLYRRITAKGFKLTRPGMSVGRYKMVRVFHKSAKADPLRFEKLKSSKQRMSSDGLNSLKYKVLHVFERPLYTKVTVEVNPKEL